MVNAEQAKRLLALHGKVEPQPPTDWTGSFPVTSDIEYFYREVGPLDVTIKAYGNPYFLPRLSHLWRFQAGYRWNGLSGDLIDDWNDDWIVVADEGGDPFIVSRPSGVVLHAYHGEGLWDAIEIFPTLNSMAACLAQLGAIVLEAGKSFTNSDCTIRSEWRSIALARLSELLDSHSAAELVLARLSWN